jgi:hypothetical protein
MVQVSKEPISTKGPRVTAQISLAGRFLVYIPDSSRVGVSRKISGGAERQRLKEQVGSILPDKAGGVIVRTVSEDVTPARRRCCIARQGLPADSSGISSAPKSTVCRSIRSRYSTRSTNT